MLHKLVAGGITELQCLLCSITLGHRKQNNKNKMANDRRSLSKQLALLNKDISCAKQGHMQHAGRQHFSYHSTTNNFINIPGVCIHSSYCTIHHCSMYTNTSKQFIIIRCKLNSSQIFVYTEATKRPGQRK